MLKVSPYLVLGLNSKKDFPCLSVYAGSAYELRSLLQKAERLGEKKYDSKVLGELFEPILDFLRRNPEETFPAAFFSTRGFAGFLRLPTAAKPLVVVADSYHVKPLLKWMQREHPFLLMELREEEAVIYQGSMSYFEKIERLPYREFRPKVGVFNALDGAIRRSVQSSRVPLLLAGDLELIETYIGFSGYKTIIEDPILDCTVIADHKRLHAAALATLEPYLGQKEDASLNSYWQAEKHGKTSAILQDIVQFALADRVSHLLINEKMNVWGRIDRSTASFTYSPIQAAPEDDVLDDLAEIVLKNGGSVTVLPANKMPNGKAACAILSGEIVPLSKRVNRLNSTDYLGPPRAATL